MDGVVQFFIEQGLLGSIVVVLAVAYWRKDAALEEARKEMVSLAQKVTEAVIALKSFGGRDG